MGCLKVNQHAMGSGHRIVREKCLGTDRHECPFSTRLRTVEYISEPRPAIEGLYATAVSFQIRIDVPS
jgi:hypothetical protein